MSKETPVQSSPPSATMQRNLIVWFAAKNSLSLAKKGPIVLFYNSGASQRSALETGMAQRFAQSSNWSRPILLTAKYCA